MTARAVYVVIGCDVDPDRAGFLNGVGADRLSWRGALEGIPALKELLRGLADDAGREPVFTWLFRADEQVREMDGAYGWFARTHRPLLESLARSGDELGWHPHFWRRAAGRGPWVQELADVDWQVEMLRRAHADLTDTMVGTPRAVRMGWSYHNNDTYQALDDLGVAVDCSAIPGFRTLTGPRPKRRENLYDWLSTPRTPYRPSRADYRRPAVAGEGTSRVLQVPSFVSASLPWSVVSGVQLTRKTGDWTQLWQAIRRPTYCINVTARPRYFAPLVSQLRRTLRRTSSVVFSTQFHADELLPNRSALYTLASVRSNLEALMRTCRQTGTRVEFTQARRIPAVWSD